MQQLGEVCDRLNPDLIVGIESRGFIVGMALATHKRIGFVPVRKPGKLPGNVVGVDYTLEYGHDRLEIQSDALADSASVLLVDDLLATGGTAAASAELIVKAGGRLVGCGFVIELAELSGRRRLPEGVPVESLIRYDKSLRLSGHCDGKACSVLLGLPIENLLVLREVEKTKAPENNRKRRLLQMGLANPKIDGVLAQSKPLLQKGDQGAGRHRLWITAEDHQRWIESFTLAVVSESCPGRPSSRTG